MLSRIKDYIRDDEFRLTIFSDRIYAINYLEILSLESDRISFKVDRGRIVIKGNNLILNKLLEGEVLISGDVLTVEVSYEE